MIVMKDLV